MNDPKPDANTLLEFAGATARQAGLASYVERGRKYRDVSDENLLAFFGYCHEEWAFSPSDPILRAMKSDVGAECDLRGLDPPTKLSRTACISLAIAVGEALKSEYQKVAIAEALCRAYLEAHANKN